MRKTERGRGNELTWSAKKARRSMEKKTKEGSSNGIIIMLIIMLIIMKTTYVDFDDRQHLLADREVHVFIVRVEENCRRSFSLKHLRRQIREKVPSKERKKGGKKERKMETNEKKEERTQETEGK